LQRRGFQGSQHCAEGTHTFKSDVKLCDFVRAPDMWAEQLFVSSLAYMHRDLSSSSKLSTYWAFLVQISGLTCVHAISLLLNALVEALRAVPKQPWSYLCRVFVPHLINKIRSMVYEITLWGKSTSVACGWVIWAPAPVCLAPLSRSN
jgi:hypothetical protein